MTFVRQPNVRWFFFTKAMIICKGIRHGWLWRGCLQLIFSRQRRIVISSITVNIIIGFFRGNSIVGFTDRLETLSTGVRRGKFPPPQKKKGKHPLNIWKENVCDEKRTCDNKGPSGYSEVGQVGGPPGFIAGDCGPSGGRNACLMSERAGRRCRHRFGRLSPEKTWRCRLCASPNAPLNFVSKHFMNIQLILRYEGGYREWQRPPLTTDKITLLHTTLQD